MSVQNIPDSVLQILSGLESAGGQAYLVGGCVRDRLLGRPVHDWDICTSLLPQQVRALFPKTVATGIAHGTVTVVLPDILCEVTTFRAETVYLDHRHPAAVSFTDSLLEDLSRRDFTINAMAMGKDGSLVDPYGGQADLRKKILRCVGSPMRRFEEDALRIFRAVRFSAQLDFCLEAETARAVAACQGWCAALSAERIAQEMEKILCSRFPERLSLFSQALRRFGWNPAGKLNFPKQLPQSRLVRWAVLQLLQPDLSLQALRLDRACIRTAAGALACGRPLCEQAEIKRKLTMFGKEAVLAASWFYGTQAKVQAVLQSGECIFLRDLAVCGRDFPQKDGKAVGEILQALLAYVWENPQKNEREFLLTHAEEILRGNETGAPFTELL